MIPKIVELLERSFPDQPKIARAYEGGEPIDVILAQKWGLLHRRIELTTAALAEAEKPPKKLRRPAYVAELRRLLEQSQERLANLQKAVYEMEAIAKRYTPSGETLQ